MFHSPIVRKDVAYSAQPMNYTHELHGNRRAPRFRLAETTPALLRFPDSHLTPGELHVISRNGGLLSLSQTVDQGSVVKLMFQTHRGPVYGTVEMLCPVSWGHQPFRFVGLEKDDQDRMQAAFQSGIFRNIEEELWIEEFRAAVANWNPAAERHYYRTALTAVTLATLCLGSVIYVFSSYLR